MATIVSRNLQKLANRDDIQPGWKRWRIEATDNRGRVWTEGPFGALQADAEIRRDAFTADSSDLDRAELLAWVQALNEVDAFDYTNRDIDQDAGEEYIFQWFAERPGDDAITVAWWVEGINTGKFNSIRDRIPYSGLEGADIQQKASNLVLAQPWYDKIVLAPTPL